MHEPPTMLAAAVLLAQALAPSAPSAPPPAPPAEAPIQTGAARAAGEWSAAEARQGAAADRNHVYAITNSAIGKYAKADGRRVGGWSLPRGGMIRHINSCMAERQRLWCANSNYPETPMASSVEVFDARSLRPVASHSLGLLDEGSLTFLDRLGDGWIAGFAHYDRNGGVPFKDHRFASIVTYDAQWRRTGGYALPASVLERMKPYAASGGAIGPDGLLYLMGHDRPELYVLARPVLGPVLVHVATLAIDAEGQAFSFDRSAPRRIVAVSRHSGLVRAFDLPPVALSGPYAARFPTRR